MKMPKIVHPVKRDITVGFKTSKINKEYLESLCEANDDITISALMDSIVDQMRQGILIASDRRKSK